MKWDFFSLETADLIFLIVVCAILFMVFYVVCG